jgi:hypothetical protein
VRHVLDGLELYLLDLAHITLKSSAARAIYCRCRSLVPVALQDYPPAHLDCSQHPLFFIRVASSLCGMSNNETCIYVATKRASRNICTSPRRRGAVNISCTQREHSPTPPETMEPIIHCIFFARRNRCEIARQTSGCHLNVSFCYGFGAHWMLYVV